MPNIFTRTTRVPWLNQGRPCDALQLCMSLNSKWATCGETTRMKDYRKWHMSILVAATQHEDGNKMSHASQSCGSSKQPKLEAGEVLSSTPNISNLPHHGTTITAQFKGHITRLLHKVRPSVRLKFRNNTRTNRKTASRPRFLLSPKRWFEMLRSSSCYSKFGSNVCICQDI